MKIGAISNPKSQRNRRDFEAIHRVIAGAPDVVHVATDSDRDLDDVLRDFADREVGLILINGGDGTVQALLSALLERSPFTALPLLAILPRGMANTTARNVGLRGKASGALPRLLQAAKDGAIAEHVERHRVLRIQNVEGAPVQRGMMIGAGAVCDAIEVCRREVYERGLKGDIGIGLTLAALLLRGAFGTRERGILRSYDMTTSLDDAPEVRSSLLLVIATTLRRLILRTRPFWNCAQAPIRYTSVAYPPSQLLRSAPKVLYGWRRATLRRDVYDSRGAHRIALGFETPFTIDGEFFRPRADLPVLVSADDHVPFVRL